MSKYIWSGTAFAFIVSLAFVFLSFLPVSGKERTDESTVRPSLKAKDNCIYIGGGEAGYEQLQRILVSGENEGAVVVLTDDVVMTDREVLSPYPDKQGDGELHRWLECRAKNVTIDGGGHSIICEDAIALRSEKVLCVLADNVAIKNLNINVRRWGPLSPDKNAGIYCLCYNGVRGGYVENVTTHGENNGLYVTEGASVTVKDCSFKYGSHSGIYLTGTEKRRSVVTLKGSISISDTGDEFMPVRAGIDVAVNSEVRSECGSLKIRPNSIGSGVRVGSGCTITGELNADISGAEYGILNRGTVEDFTGIIKESKRYGIYQRGRLGVSKDASVAPGSSNRIFLFPGKRVDVVGGLYGGDRCVGYIKTQNNDRRIGRVVATVTRDRSAAAYYQSDGRWRESRACFMADPSDYPKGPSTGGKDMNTPIVLRAGNGVNAAEGEIIISAELNAKYRQSFEKLPKGVSIIMPEAEKFFWKEEKSFDLSRRPRVLYGEIDISESMVCTGYRCVMKRRHKGFDKKVFSGEKIFPAKVLDRNIFFDAVWEACYDLKICGNAQTKGEDYILESLDEGAKLPFNCACDSENLYRENEGYFKKADRYTSEENKEKMLRYNANTDSYPAFYDVYSFAGWSLRSDALSSDEDIHEPGKPMSKTDGSKMSVYDYLALFADSIEKSAGDDNTDENEAEAIDEEGRVIITLYCVWDRAPVITAFDMVFLKADADGEKITEKALLENVSADDREDKTIPRENLSVSDYDSEEFKNLGEAGSCEVIVCAGDSAGNKSFEKVEVYIQTDSSMTSRLSDEASGGKDRQLPNYIRFVDSRFYELGAGASPGMDIKNAIEKQREGAMEPYSVWYQLPEYRDEIRLSLKNLDTKKYKKSYSYSVDDIKKGVQYIVENQDSVSSEGYRGKFYRKICIFEH